MNGKESGMYEWLAVFARSVPLAMVFWMAAAVAEEPIPRVATVTPITHSLSSALLRNTSFDVQYLPPKRLPVNRIDNWLRKNRTRRFGAFDALVSIGDAVPELAFSTTLRQSNVRLVTIDVAYARVPEGERVVLDDPNAYFWLNSNNLLLMLGILKRDLVLLWPEQQTLINQNYRALSNGIRKHQLELEEVLDAHDVAVLVFDQPNLRPMTGSLALDTMTLEEAQALALPAVRVSRHSARPSNAAADKRGVPKWQVDDLSRFSDVTLLERLQGNVERLQEALARSTVTTVWPLRRSRAVDATVADVRLTAG